VSLPAAIVTDAGTVAALVFEIVNFTTKPPTGAALLMATVPVTFVVELPLTEAGEIARDNNVGD